MNPISRQGITAIVGMGLVLSLASCNLMEKLPFGKPSGGQTGNTPTTSPAVPDEAAVKVFVDAGDAYTKERQWSQAIDQYQKAVAANPHHAYAHAQMGWAYAELKQWDKAKQALLHAIKNDPRLASAHANLAWVYAEQKRWPEAQEHAKKAIDLDPSNGYAHATLAWAYQETKQPDLAIAEYQKSVELIPGLENSHLALGMAYCDKGLTSRAQDHQKKLAELKSPLAVQLAERISQGCAPAQ